MLTDFRGNAVDQIYLDFRSFMTPLSGKSIVILKSAAVKPAKEVGAAFCFCPGSGVMAGENHASFWLLFLERRLMSLVTATLDVCRTQNQCYFCL